MGDLTGRFKDEVRQGCLFGPEHRRDEILSAVLANIGLMSAVRFAPRELWERADRGAGRAPSWLA